MTNLLTKIEIWARTAMADDRESYSNLGVILDCAYEDLEDPNNDNDAARYLLVNISDERPLLEPWLDAIEAAIIEANAA